MNRSWTDITLALAGIVQTTDAVDRLAKTGYLETHLFNIAVKSLLERSPANIEAVFGGVSGVNQGLDLVQRILKNHRDPAFNNVLRYTLSVLHLQKKLSKRSDMLSVIATRLDKAGKQADVFQVDHDNVIANIADIYTDTISRFNHRIQVTGDYNYLQQQRVANQIRVLLLASIRAATLWRQVGGSRWQLLFYRSQLIDAAKKLKYH